VLASRMTQQYSDLSKQSIQYHAQQLLLHNAPANAGSFQSAQAVNLSKSCPAMKISNRLKRKQLLDVDVDDNYHEQKRYISEKLAQEIRFLSISTPPATYINDMGSLHHLKCKQPFSQTSVSCANDAPLPACQDDTSRYEEMTTCDDTSAEDTVVFLTFPRHRHVCRYKAPSCRMFHFKSPKHCNEAMQDFSSDSNADDDSEWDAPMRLFPLPLILNPSRELLDRMPGFFPDASKAIIPYRPALEVVFDPVHRESRANQMQQDRNEASKMEQTLHEIEQEMEEIYLEDIEML